MGVRSQPRLDPWIQTPVSGYWCALGLNWGASPGRPGRRGRPGAGPGSWRRKEGREAPARRLRPPEPDTAPLLPGRTRARSPAGGGARAQVPSLPVGAPHPRAARARLPLNRTLGLGGRGGRARGVRPRRGPHSASGVHRTLPTRASGRPGPTWRAGVRVPSTSNRQRTRSRLRAPSAVTAMAAAAPRAGAAPGRSRGAGPPSGGGACEGRGRGQAGHAERGAGKGRGLTEGRGLEAGPRADQPSRA